MTKKISILHCRSYPATLSAVLVKKIRKIKIVFDPRSDFPEENVTAGRWRKSSLSYKMWKYLETKYLKDSDVTVAISTTYVHHFDRISPGSNFAIIPNNVNTNRFIRDAESRLLFRSEEGIAEDKLVFCYCGSLGDHYWHSPDTYANYMIKLRSLNIPHRFLFITPAVILLKKRFASRGIRPEEYLCINSDFSDVPKYLSSADLGIIFLNDFKIAMAIKTSEYLAMGLPVITNSCVTGAKEIIEQNDVGLVFDLNSNVEILNDYIRNLLTKRKIIMEHCRSIACKLFSNHIVSKKYYDLYRSL